MASLLIVLLVGPIWLYGRTVGTKIFLERNIGPNRTAKQQQSPAIDDAVEGLIQEQQALLKSMIEREGGGVSNLACSVGQE